MTTENEREQILVLEEEVRRLNESHGLNMDAHIQQVNDLEQQLAAAQAQIVGYRDALLRINRNIDAANKARCGDVYHATCNRIVAEALAQPADTSALEAIIKQAGEAALKRCADKAHDIWCCDDGEIYEAIRALPGVTLEDLQK